MMNATKTANYAFSKLINYLPVLTIFNVVLWVLIVGKVRTYLVIS